MGMELRYVALLYGPDQPGLVARISGWIFEHGGNILHADQHHDQNGPRMTPFHGGCGLLNYQSIRKPAYFAYRFLNRLGPEELVNGDDSSWVCRNPAGDVQALLWDFTPVAPPQGVNDQVFYKQEQPSLQIGR